MDPIFLEIQNKNDQKANMPTSTRKQGGGIQAETQEGPGMAPQGPGKPPGSRNVEAVRQEGPRATSGPRIAEAVKKKIQTATRVGNLSWSERFIFSGLACNKLQLKHFYDFQYSTVP